MSPRKKSKYLNSRKEKKVILLKDMNSKSPPQISKRKILIKIESTPGPKTKKKLQGFPLEP